MLPLGVAVLFCLLLPTQVAQATHTEPPGPDKAHKGGLSVHVLNVLTGLPATPGPAEAHQGGLSVHVLNVLTGLPVTGLAMRLSQLGDSDAQWKGLLLSTTDHDGRVGHPLQLKAATYKVRFETGAYWQRQGYSSFYPYVEVVFTVTQEERKVHIPLLLSPYSYATYSGS